MRKLFSLALSSIAVCTCLAAQAPQETLSGADRNEHDLERQSHLFGDLGGVRSFLQRKGVQLNLLVAGDQLWNVQSSERERFSVWTRARGTVDWNLEKVSSLKGTTLHLTAVWQAGSNLGNYLGTIAGPSGIASDNTFRLDSWWIEQHLLNEKLALRIGQFAAQDSYGDQFFGSSFIFEPFQYGLGNRSATFESFDPPSSSAFEVRVVPVRHVYVKAIAFGADRTPYAHNQTGLIPQFRGAASSASEVGYVTGDRPALLRPKDTVETRRGYSGLYRFGASYNPGNFENVSSSSRIRGNYLVYGSVNQVLYRLDKQTSKGLDLAISGDFTPANRSVNTQDTDVGLRWNEPLPLRWHNTIGMAWVRSELAPRAPGTQAFRAPAENALEVNSLVDVGHGILVQPVAQYYANAGGSAHNVVVVGFHTKVDF